ncbi:MAG TPA: response regulator transcription factor [Chitinophagaceae bacterium]|nr:response regulator transcription factor [Chitinophagaceae bacterium]
MRFLVADDHSIVRMGVKLMLEGGYPNVTIDEAENGSEIVEKVKANSYELLILDFQMPNTDSFSIISYLLARDVHFKILVYSMATEKIFAGKLLKAGVKGFLSKETKNTELLKAVAVILNDEIYATEQAGISKANNPFDDLSNKEMDILAFLVQGKTTKEISILSNLQLSTVSTHKFRIFRKLNVNNIVELIALTQEYPLH